MISDVKDDGSGTTEYDEFLKVITNCAVPLKTSGMLCFVLLNCAVPRNTSGSLDGRQQLLFRLAQLRGSPEDV